MPPRKIKNQIIIDIFDKDYEVKATYNPLENPVEDMGFVLAVINSGLAATKISDAVKKYADSIGDKVFYTELLKSYLIYTNHINEQINILQAVPREPERRIAWECYQEEEPEEMDEANLPEGIGYGLLISRAQAPKNPVNDRECRVGSTNFTLDDSELKSVSTVPGIEMLQSLGRYTFAVMLGKMFDFTTVRPEIEKRLGVIYESSE